jgi:2-polyprenyl-3-methyl-5-hydroxy-6-metoxy-1,4-benzoquinol methylase
MGSGMGTISKYLAAYGKKTILTDINEEYISYLSRRFIGNPFVRVVQADICDIDSRFKNEKIDTIIGINVLEHIENDAGLLRKTRDILVKDGKLLLVVPAHQVLFGVFDKSLQHYRRYSRKDLADKLKNAGFMIEKLEYMNFISAIGWFINYKILKRKRMSLATVWIADKFIPLTSVMEKHVKFPFGLSLFAVARK